MGTTALKLAEQIDHTLGELTIYGPERRLEAIKDINRQNEALSIAMVDFAKEQGLEGFAEKVAYHGTSLVLDTALINKAATALNTFATVANASMAEVAHEVANAATKAPALEAITAEGIAVKVPQSTEICALSEAQDATGFSGQNKAMTNSFETEVKWASDYYKHRPPKNVPWKDIIKSTTHGNARYKPGINIKELELHAWKYGEKSTNGKSWKVFKSNEIIGANSGKETYFMRIECSANTIHGHPILESQYLELIK